MNRALPRLISTAFAVVAAIALAVAPAVAAPAASPAHCPPGLGKQLSPGQARGIDLTGCETDAAVVVDGVGVALPEPGTGLAAFGVKTGGEETSLIVRTDEAGVVDVQVAGEEAPAEHAAAAAVTRCSDSSYKLLGAKWYTTPTFRINSAERRPSTFTAAAWTTVVKNAVSAVRTGKNSCGSAPLKAPGATMSTTADANVTTANACATPDTISVVDFGSLSGSTLGLTCVAFKTHSGHDQIVTADTRLDNSSRSWVAGTGGCSGAKYDLLATATHEIGHAYGLNHAVERGGNDLMMSPVVSSCSSSARTLGKGDMLGMLQLYPR